MLTLRLSHPVRVAAATLLLTVSLVGHDSRAQDAAPRTATSAAVREPLRPAVDLRDLRRLSLIHTEALQLLREGDALLSRGEASKAAELFSRASQAAPETALLLRRLCQALTWANRRSEALDACRRALLVSSVGTSMTLRANVGALMSTTPTVEDLARALFYAQQSVQQAPDQPWGYAARCDIAFRLGEANMLNTCKHELLTMAPLHYESDRVRKWAVAKTPIGVLGAWALLTIFSLYTVLHALFGARGNSRIRRLLRWRAPSVALALLLPLVPTPARAQDSITEEKSAPAGGLSKWPVNREDPVSSVPRAEDRDGNPLEYGYHLMDLSDLALAAAQRRDYAAAAKFYEAAVKAAPDTAAGYRRACDFNEKAGKPERALRFCRGALGLDGVLIDDYIRYSHLLFSQKTPLTKEQDEDVAAMVAHLKSDPNGGAAAAQIECQLALARSDRKQLETCTSTLAKLAPKEPTTISFQWSLAMIRGDLDQAQHLVLEAKQTAMKPEGIATMERAVQAELRWPRRIQRHRWTLFTLLGGGALLLVGAWVAGNGKRREKLSEA